MNFKWSDCRSTTDRLPAMLETVVWLAYWFAERSKRARVQREFARRAALLGRSQAFHSETGEEDPGAALEQFVK